MDNIQTMSFGPYLSYQEAGEFLATFINDIADQILGPNTTFECGIVEVMATTAGWSVVRSINTDHFLEDDYE